MAEASSDGGALDDDPCPLTYAVAPAPDQRAAKPVSIASARHRTGEERDILLALAERRFGMRRSGLNCSVLESQARRADVGTLADLRCRSSAGRAHRDFAATAGSTALGVTAETGLNDGLNLGTIASTTRSIAASRTRKNTAARPGCSVRPICPIRSSGTPMSISDPLRALDPAPTPAPTTAPASGLRNSRPRSPQMAPLAAP